MLAKNSRPIIGKLARMTDPATSPLDAKKGIKNYDHHHHHHLGGGGGGGGGVGLGIAVALEKSSGLRNPVLVSRSNPIPVNGGERYSSRGYLDKMKLDLEDYTFVTRHQPNNSSSSSSSSAYTRVVYCDRIVEHDHRRTSRNVAVFDISPARFSDEQTPPPAAAGAGHRESDFLSRCHLCQKKLHGKDIYMYRGEKAFCSTECRYREIVTDERKEKKQQQQKYYCGSEASSSSSSSRTPSSTAAAAADISGSPYSYNGGGGGGPMFSTGILAV